MGNKGSSKKDIKTSLVVQWLRCHTPNAGGLSLILGQGARSHMPKLRPGAAEKKKKTRRVENRT